MIVAILVLASLIQQPSQLKLISTLASSLSEGNPAAAMATFEKSAPGYESISANIYALTSQADLTCSIDAIEQNGNEVEADWFLMVRSKQESGPTERRQVKVKITFVQVGKDWKIRAIDPRSILDPPQ
jgi:hypothetical protein